MQITKPELLNIHKKAYEVVSYVDSLPRTIKLNTVLIDDISLEIFNPEDYPFKLSFDEELASLDEIFEEKDIAEIYQELGEEYIDKYVDYVNNTLCPRYKKLLHYMSNSSIF